MENIEEKWKDIKGFEGHYQVSDKGRVKSVKFGKERILSIRRSKFGYLLVNLWKNHKMKTFKIHRLVAQAFLPNQNNLPQVNHKDEDKTNNYVENLEWCTVKYNNIFGTRLKRVSVKATNGKCSKKVLQYTLDGKFVKEWKSTHDVERNLGYAQTNISSCCLGKYKSAYGYVWKYK